MCYYFSDIKRDNHFSALHRTNYIKNKIKQLENQKKSYIEKVVLGTLTVEIKCQK